MRQVSTRDLPSDVDPRHQPALPAEYYRRSSVFGYVHTIPTLALFLCCVWGLGVLPPGAWKVLCAVGTTLVGYRLTFVVHDCSHRTLFARKWENEVAGWLSASLLLVSFPAYRRLHWIHHLHFRRLGDPQGPDYNGLVPGRDRVVWHLLKPLLMVDLPSKVLAFFALQHAGFAPGEREQTRGLTRIESPAQRVVSLLVIAAVQAAVVWLSTAGLTAPLGYAWYVGPIVTLGLFMSRVRSYLEHGSLEPDHETRLVARTHPSNWLERNVLAGLYFNLHNEHHRWPQVPSRHLPAVYRDITAGALASYEYSPSYWASLRTLWRASTRTHAK